MWHMLTENPHAITSLYDEVPLLQAVDLVSLVLHHDGPRMELYVDLPQFPDRPPTRWKQDGFNAVQLRLDFFVIEAIEMAGWSTEIVVDIDIEKAQGNYIELTARGPRFRLVVACKSCSIANLTGYKK